MYEVATSRVLKVPSIIIYDPCMGRFSQDFKEEITFLETLQIEKYM